MTGYLRQVLAAMLLIAATIILSQDFQIFPGAFRVINDVLPPLSTGINEHFIETPDGNSLQIWHLPAEKEDSPVIMFFNGNASTLANLVGFQLWAKDQGFTSYSFNYRGYGKSTGWPSEEGVYQDAETVYAFARKKEPSSSFVFFGISLGTGPSSYLATQHKPKSLILLSPYTSIVDLVWEYTLFWPFAPFVWTEFPVEKNVAALQETDLIVAHGKLDQVIPYEYGERVIQSYQGSGSKNFISSDKAGHFDIMDRVKDRIAKLLK